MPVLVHTDMLGRARRDWVPADYTLTVDEKRRGARVEPDPSFRCTDFYRSPIEAREDAA